MYLPETGMKGLRMLYSREAATSTAGLFRDRGAKEIPTFPQGMPLRKTEAHTTAPAAPRPAVHTAPATVHNHAVQAPTARAAVHSPAVHTARAAEVQAAQAAALHTEEDNTRISFMQGGNAPCKKDLSDDIIILI